MSLEIIGKFIGPEEVISTKEVGKTPLGKSVLEVETQIKPSGSNEPAQTAKRVYTEPTIEAVLTDEQGDWNSFRDRKFRHMVSTITELAIEYGITGEEMDPLLMAAGRNFATMIDKAVYSKWFGETETFVPGGTSFHGFSLLDAHNELIRTTNTTGEGLDTTDQA